MSAVSEKVQGHPRPAGPARPPLLVVLPNEPSPSETFLRAHIELLPARVTAVVSGLPSVNGVPLRSQVFLLRAWRKAWRLLSGQTWEAERTAAYRVALRRFRPAAVLAEYGEMGVAVLDACREARVPLVVHFHGYDASLRECLQRLAVPYQEMFREAAAVVAVSRAMRERLIELGAPPEKVHWNPYGVDCSAFGGANPATAPATFLSVGRFTAKKAPDLTLRAFARVRQKVPGAQLRMVGFGPLLEPCRKLAGELGLDGAVTFLGACPPPVIQGEMRRARCFVQHSIVAPDGDSEGTPVSILEAGASGLPVVSTRHAGIPDVVLDGVTGLLVEEGDVEGMACALVRLALDPDLAARLGQAARQRIAEHFSLPDRIGRLWAILDSCIAGAPLSARRPGEGSGVHSCYPDPGGAGGRPCASR